jgi:hypothetical protein
LTHFKTLKCSSLYSSFYPFFPIPPYLPPRNQQKVALSDWVSLAPLLTYADTAQTIYRATRGATDALSHSTFYAALGAVSACLALVNRLLRVLQFVLYMYDINQTTHLFSFLFNVYFSTLSVSHLVSRPEARPPGAAGLIDCDPVQQHPLQPHDIRASETARRDEGERRQAGVSVGYLTQGRLLRSLWQLLSCVLGSEGGCLSHSDAALKVLRYFVTSTLK